MKFQRLRRTGGYSWEIFKWFPLNGISGDGIVFIAEIYQGEGEIIFQDARRGLAMFLWLHAFFA